MRTLPTGTYQPCKREDIGMHSLATVVGQTWGQLQEKYRECESILTILRGVYVTEWSILTRIPYIFPVVTPKFDRLLWLNYAYLCLPAYRVGRYR